jgi:hypothetical protein
LVISDATGNLSRGGVRVWTRRSLRYHVNAQNLREMSLHGMGFLTGRWMSGGLRGDESDVVVCQDSVLNECTFIDCLASQDICKERSDLR